MAEFVLPPEMEAFAEARATELWVHFSGDFC